MPRPQVEQPTSASPSPANWESSPWLPEDRAVEEPFRLGAREEPLRLSDEHVVEAALDSESIRRV
ncbi:MAG TPA: hypothetical protein VLW85_04440 [Myxococcales bacterium]|nr:hypothetical protein [Myxococcales bacterium]